MNDRAPLRLTLPLLSVIPTLILIAVFYAGLGAGVLRAEITPWASNEGGRMRLAVMPPEPDGKIRGVLQIEPKPGWITYWREPGDTGIPPKISLSQPSGPSPASDISFGTISFPVPKRIDNGALRDIGYDKPVSFPFELTTDTPDRPLSFTVSAFIGLCRNICIPFEADFSLALKPARGTPVEEAMILNTAAMALPEPPSDQFAVTHYVMTQGGNVLRLTLRLPDDTSSAPQIIVSGPEGHILLDGINGRREGSSYTLDMPIGKLPKGYDIKGKRWSILAIAGGRAMETSLAFD